MDLIIRLASPLQTWAGYRVRHADVDTNPTPTKSGVAGLLAACIGRRDYLTLLDRFTLRVRVDRTNATEADLQVAVPPTAGRGTEHWHRSAALHAACHSIAAGQRPRPYTATQINITGGTKVKQFSENRTFIPHAEFVCHIAAADDLADELVPGFRRPVYTPYLGRAANPPCFPFYLGAWRDDGDPLAALPYLPRHDESPEAPNRPLRVHTVTGGHTAHHTTYTLVHPPRAADRNSQLDWVKEHLQR